MIGSHTEAAMTAPYHELPARWRAPARWLLLRLATWADGVEAEAGDKKSSFYWQVNRQGWERKRLERFQDLLATVRVYASTASQLREGSKRVKPQRLGRILGILKNDLSASPFAGVYCDAQGIGMEHDAHLCGKDLRTGREFSRSHRLCGCYVWLSRSIEYPNRWYWEAWHPRRGASSTGITPLEAVRNCLRLWRHWWTWDNRARQGRLTDRELGKIHCSLLRKAIELRGGHPQGNRRAQLMAVYRRPQASLMAILQKPRP